MGVNYQPSLIDYDGMKSRVITLWFQRPLLRADELRAQLKLSEYQLDHCRLRFKLPTRTSLRIADTAAQPLPTSLPRNLLIGPRGPGNMLAKGVQTLPPLPSLAAPLYRARITEDA